MAQQGMAVEVDPDERSGDAAFIPGERPQFGRAHGVDGRLLAGDRIADRLDLGEGVLPITAVISEICVFFCPGGRLADRQLDKGRVIVVSIYIYKEETCHA